MNQDGGASVREKLMAPPSPFVTTNHAFLPYLRRAALAGAAAGALFMPVAASAAGYNDSDDGVTINDDSLAFGQQFTVTAVGFKPGTTVQVYFKSTPVLLGTLTADATGTVSGSFAVPAGAVAGAHTVEFQGTGPTGAALVLQQAVVVSASTNGGNASTGAVVLPFVLAGAGLAGGGVMVRKLGRRRAGA